MGAFKINYEYILEYKNIYNKHFINNYNNETKVYDGTVALP